MTIFIIFILNHLREDSFRENYKILRPKRAARPSFMRNFIWRLKKMLDGRNVRTRSVRELVAMKELLNARECGEDRFYLLERNRCPRDPLGECTTERRLTHCLHVRSPTLARSANWVPKTFYFAALDENSDACHLWTISSQYLLKTMKTRIKQLS